jgi:P27 family predicted phage terminase small subunit
MAVKCKPAPKSMPKDGASLWARLQTHYEVQDEAGLAVLEVACRSYSTLLEAERLVKRDGLVVKGDRGLLKAHPAAAIARDARSGMLQAFKNLGFEVPKAEEPEEE